MNSFDIAALILTASSAARGYRAGLSSEFYRLFRLVVALVTGTSAYGLLAGILGGLTDHSSVWLSPVIFVGVSVLAWKLLKRFRLWSEATLTARVPGRYQAIGGAMAAAVKTLVLLGGVVVAFHLAEWLPGHNLIARDSVFSTLLSPILR